MHAGTLAQLAQNALAILGTSPILRDCYLAGGSALALHLGHRKSFDLDFYTRETFRAEDVVTELTKLGEFTTTLLKPPHTVLGTFSGVKFSLFRYNYPLIGKPSSYKNVTIASVKDIAAMKLSAITGRATKRDYVDIYTISLKYTLDEQLRWYDKKFGKLGSNLYFIIRALGYFEDAETDDMPELVQPIVWEKVKAYLATESLRLGKKLLE